MESERASLSLGMRVTTEKRRPRCASKTCEEMPVGECGVRGGDASEPGPGSVSPGFSDTGLHGQLG